MLSLNYSAGYPWLEGPGLVHDVREATATVTWSWSYHILKRKRRAMLSLSLGKRYHACYRSRGNEAKADVAVEFLL